MKLVAIISIVFIFLLIYRIGYLKKNSKGKYIYIGAFTLIIIINGFILKDYVKVKSVHNYSTYITYQNMLDRITDLRQYELNDTSDVKDFSEGVNRLNSQVALLSYQIDQASLIRGSKKDMISNLDLLSLELHAFTNYQKGLIDRQDEIPVDSLPIYNEFKEKITELKAILEVQENRLTSNLVGIAQYRIRPEKNQFDELGNLLEAISKINSRLLKL